ncbi:MAG: hypothetical protein E7368_00010 [Clostridiales bacterium]|nr:hypothetical protein [Clostridiales bacterium]
MNKRTQFDFIAYMTPPPENPRGDGRNDVSIECQTDEHYSNIVKCGFNGTSAIYEYDEAEYEKALTLCDKYGLTMLVRDQKGLEQYVVKELCVTGETAEEWLAKNAEAMKNRLDLCAKHPSFAGVLAADEPHTDKYPHLKILQDWFNENYPGKEFEVNLLPDYASAEQLFNDEKAEFTYEKYLDDFVEIVKPEYLSYDHYALIKDRTTGEEYLRPSYLKNLEYFAKASKRIGKEFKVFLLTLGHWDFRTVTTYEEIAWQVYTSMAYGASGAQTFTYWTSLEYEPYNNPANVTTALVGQKGELLPAWYAMQETIAEVRSFEKAYFNYRWDKCIYFLAGESNKLTEPLDKNTDACLIKAKTTGDVVVGCFTNEANKAYLISNLTDPKDKLSAKIQLYFDKDYSVIVWKDGKKTETNTKNKELCLDIRCGSGAFIEIK